MSILPPVKTPLNQHSLRQLESWLMSLGAEKCINNPCLWEWITSQGSAQIIFQQDELMVVWGKGEMISQYSFPYGLSRQEIEAAYKTWTVI